MILVTGGTGLVGAHLLYHLSLKNENIIATYRSKEKIELSRNVFSLYDASKLEKLFTKITWIPTDITDIPALENVFKSYPITIVYHCAALISFQPKEYQKMRKINIEGTANLVNLSLHYQIKKFCFVSSIATLGDSVNSKPVTEETEYNQDILKNGYTITKHGAEMEVWRGSQEGLDVIIINPGVILGSGFNNGSSEIFSQIQKGLKFYTEGKTGFVGVVDVVKAMILLMESSIKNERFILVSENKTFKEIFFQIADELELKRPSIKATKLMTSLYWRIEWLLSKICRREPLITKHSAKSSHEITLYSSLKIQKKLDFKFTSINEVISLICKTINQQVL